MKKQIIIVLIGIASVACNSKIELPEGELSSEQIEALNEDAVVGVEDIKYEGTYEGEIRGKKVKLTLESDSFQVSENDKKAHGDWSRVDDGTIIELEPTSGSVAVRFYGYSDDKTWIALSDSLTYPDKEEFIIRTSK